MNYETISKLIYLENDRVWENMELPFQRSCCSRDGVQSVERGQVFRIEKDA